MSDFVLYSYFRSSASYRVRIALELKGIAYDYRAVHLLNNGGEQRAEPYVSLNPSAEVPTLVHEGRVLSQSMAIMHYLDAVAPREPLLFPKDTYLRARALQACEIVNSGVQPLGNLKVLQELERRFGATAEQKTAWSAHWIHAGLKALEALLTATAGRHCFGDAPGAADAFLIPQIFNAARVGVSLETYPTLARINENCLKLDPFQRAAPSAQPDSPKEG